MNLTCTCGSRRFIEREISTTLMGFGMEGKHEHDPNWWSTTYECENGHLVSIEYRKGCPACSWPKK